MIDFVNSADVGMAEGRRRPRFTLEAIKRHCICTELGGGNLSARCRPSVTSSPSYTTPIPPLPNLLRMR
jgi:hypothetical protein